MSRKTRMTVSEVNKLTYDQFIRQFAEVVDNCVFLAAAVWHFRPFRSLTHLQQAFENFMTDLPLAGKEAILRLMPDVTGKSAQRISLGKESISERAAASLDTLTQTEIHIMTSLNEQYTRKFGFHFVLCARKNKKSAFLDGLKTRLENSPEVEAVIGVGEVKKVCSLRLKDLVEDSVQVKSLL